MADREKVLKGLECCSAMDGEQCRKCPYAKECEESKSFCFAGTAHLSADALELLKEMKKVKVKNIKLVGDDLMGTCPRCLRVLTIQDHTGFCGTCGQAVKWE